MSSPAEKAAWERGYLCCVANLANQYGHIDLCERMLEEGGISRRRMLSLGLAECDEAVLKTIYSRRVPA